jgi:hypothetical protein
MKKVLMAIGVVIVLAGAGIYLFQEPIEEMAIENMTSDMFVASDDDAFDPGLPVGAQFPPILASLDGATITDVSQYSGPNGLVFVANRSVDW